MAATSCCMAGHPRGHSPKLGTFDAKIWQPLRNDSLNNGIGVKHPAIVREIPHFGVFPAFPHFCKKVPHFWLNFERKNISKIARKTFVRISGLTLSDFRRYNLQCSPRRRMSN